MKEEAWAGPPERQGAGWLLEPRFPKAASSSLMKSLSLDPEHSLLGARREFLNENDEAIKACSGLDDGWKS